MPPDESMIEFNLQGHRGARGLLPENSIPSFIKALEFGVQTLELDVSISADQEVIVTHEPWISSGICSHADGRPVGEDEERSLNIYELTAEEVAGYDCGSRGHGGFPGQARVSTIKPVLRDVVEAVDNYVTEHSIPAPVFNVEIKSSLQGEGVYHPGPEEFVSIVHAQLVELGIRDRTTIQSFDPRALEAMHLLDPEIAIGWLVGNEDGFEANMDRLTFVPDYYSPSHRLVSGQLTAAVHQAGMLLIPWTVNEADRMRELVDLGVDGLITDYPDRARSLLNSLTK